MQTGQLKLDMQRLLTKAINKIHTRKSKLNFHHKCSIKLIIHSINPWTDPSSM